MHTASASRPRSRSTHLLAGGIPRVLLFPPCAVSPLWCSDELELRYATAGALVGTTNRLYADSNSGFKVRYRSVPTVQSGYTITH